MDQGLHAGGAFSATIPLVALYYGGFIDIDVEDPTRVGQDIFVLSKGHAVAALASIYAELGYFDRSVLRNSRSYDSILNGHPGPILPGVSIATGPMGQGFGVAQGFAIAGKLAPRFDSYCMTGDGELQEGPIWEAVMFAGQKHLDNLCLLVDRNNGQLDISSRMVFPMPELEPVFESFDWQVFSVDATSYDGVYAALEEFRYGPRNGKPTAIICHSTKGYGALSDFLNRHKVVVDENLLEQEVALQSELRARRVDEFRAYYARLGEHSEGAAYAGHAGRRARATCISTCSDWSQVVGPVVTQPRSAARQAGSATTQPCCRRSIRRSSTAPRDIVTGAMKVFARDSRVVSIDSDLATTSGLEAGVAAVDQRRALNAGVAEANMMALGEAFAALGYNAWISTFCPFCDWKVHAPHRGGLPGASGSHRGPGRLAERGPRARSDHAGHRVELRDAHQRRHPHGQRRCPGLRRHRAPEDHRRLLPAAAAVDHAVDHGRKSRAGLRAGDADPSAVIYGRDYTFEFGKGT